MRTLPLRPARLALALFSAIAISAAASSSLSAQDPPAVIKACVQKASTQMRLVADGSACRPNEDLVIWNIQGPPGPKGDPGAPGPQGPPGEGLATGTVRGRLVGCGPAGGDVMPAGNITLHLEGHSYTAMTNSNGEFVFHFVVPGTYRLIQPPRYGDPIVVTAGQTIDLGDVLSTNLQVNPFHCGVCGNACGPTGTCVNGGCQAVPPPACPAGLPFRCANGTCAVDSTMCGTPPPPDDCPPATPYRCADGTCATNSTLCLAPNGCPLAAPYRCISGMCAVSGPMCVPPEGCLTEAQCGFGQSCMNGLCVQTCAPGEGLCAGLCVSLNTTQNCGTCGHACAAGQVCGAGICMPDPNLCAPGQTNCAGVCANTMTDPLNCGGCNLVCGAPHTIAACAAAVCQFTCEPGWSNCDNNIGNGCETFGVCGGGGS